MTRVELKNVTKVFGENEVIRDINFTIEDGEFAAILGPSGCGKTTTLRMIAGLETLTSGDILFDGESVKELSPYERNVAMVFQNYAIYPHLTVGENIEAPLEARDVPKNEREERAKETASFLNIGDLLDRKPDQLSGGQRQRVALARAIVREPSVYLMDEPLSNLDAKLRLEMRSELKRLQKELGVTTVYVTHDQVEAMTMAEKIALLNEGVLQQVDDADGLYSQPENTWVAGFIGSPSMNLIECSLTRENNRIYLDGEGFKIELRENIGERVAKKVQSPELALGLRPEELSVRREEPSTPYSIKGRVRTIEPLGEYTIINLEIGDNVVKAKVESEVGSPGEDLYMIFPEEAMFLYEQGGKLLFSA